MVFFQNCQNHRKWAWKSMPLSSTFQSYQATCHSETLFTISLLNRQTWRQWEVLINHCIFTDTPHISRLPCCWLSSSLYTIIFWCYYIESVLAPAQEAAVHWHSVPFVYYIYVLVSLSWPLLFTVYFSPPPASSSLASLCIFILFCLTSLPVACSFKQFQFLA